MHSCHITILSQNVYFATSNNLRKYLSVAGVSSYFTRSLIVRKKKNPSILVILGSDTHISDAITNLFITFGPDILAYLKHIYIQIREKKQRVRLQAVFDFLGKNTGPKKPVYEPNPLLPTPLK